MTFEGILPKCKHLKIALPSIILGGVWPDTIFNLSFFWRVIYKLYSHFVFYFFICLTFGLIVQCFVFIQDIQTKIGEFLWTLSYAVVWLMTIARANALKKPIMKKLIQNIIDGEIRIFIGGDKDFIDIQNSHISKNNAICLIYGSSVIVYVLFCLARFLIINTEVIDPLTKETVIRKPHTLEVWLPFDRDEYYTTARFLEGAFTVIVTYLVMGSDCLSYSIQTYIISQLKMLNHIFENVGKFEMRVKNQLGCDEEEAMFLVLRESVIFHQYILGYIDDYNSTMDIVALTEFIVLSLQLATCVVPKVVGLPTVIGIFFISLGIIISAKFFIYYWLAEEITTEAQKVMDSIYNSNWTEKPLKIKYMYKFVMMRSLKMTGLSIGPLGIMSMRVYLMLIRSTYSFVTLVNSLF